MIHHLDYILLSSNVKYIKYMYSVCVLSMDKSDSRSTEFKTTNVSKKFLFYFNAD